MFHCAAGKDRTGLVSALVLAICEVPDEEIVADFAFTEARMPTIIARHTARAELGDRAAEVAGQQYGAPPVTMDTVLARLRAEHGDLVAYVESTGLTPPVDRPPPRRAGRPRPVSRVERATNEPCVTCPGTGPRVE